MDKYEYKVRADEIKQLISQGEYVQAAEIADTIDWRRVKSVMMLCTISDLYKINRRYEDARDMLLLAYERRPGGRTICYSLCELSIKMEEYVQAIEYYKEFVQVASKDPGRYILQYKLYEAQDVGLEERIAVLEELKKRDYREKWAYELAYLYHRVGLAARCVEECDELILWFGDGKYVIKAMELKMLHEPLTAKQQEKYDNRYAVEKQEDELTYQNAEEADEAGIAEEQYTAQQTIADTQVYAPEKIAEEAAYYQEHTPSEELDIHVKTVDVSQYNTINLQAELAEGLREVLAGESRGAQPHSAPEKPLPAVEGDTESLDYPEIDEVSEEDLEPDSEEMEGTEVFFGETGEIGSLGLAENAAGRQDRPLTVPDITAQIVLTQLRQETERQKSAAVEECAEEKEEQEEILSAEPPKELAHVLSQESDGQLSLVMPESENIEKQITGQMNIEDILAEWERIKKENQEVRKEQVRRHVLQHTGSMFTEFELAVRDGLLEQLQKQEKLDPVEEKELATGKRTVGMEAAGRAAEKTVPWNEEESAGSEIPSDEQEETAGSEVSSDEQDKTVGSEVSSDEQEETAGLEIPSGEQEETAGLEILSDEQEETAGLEILSDEQEETAGSEILSDEQDKTAGSEISDKAREEVRRERPVVRTLTKEEKALFAPYVQSRSAREQLVKAIDSISLAAYTGNVIITGEAGMDTMTLAKNMIREVQATDRNFSGKVAKISGRTLNKRSISEMLGQLENGALIISGASELDKTAVGKLYKELQREDLGIIIVMEDTKKAIDKFLKENEQLRELFNARMDVEALSNDRLVAFGKQYAREREYSIDELGILALHTRIAELQTIDHVVTVMEVKNIVDEAIENANRKTLKHFVNILFAKRYDEEDMIVLTEKDFV